MLKRLIVIILLLLAGAVVALPGAVGLIAEHQHDRFVEQINADGDQLIEERYERRWFSTHTRYRYRIEDQQLRKFLATFTQEPEGIPELLVDSDIFHGPLPVIAGGPGHDILGWTDIDSTLRLRSPSGAETELPGELQSRIEPDGSSRFRYHADAETRALREGMTVSWQEADIEIVLGRGRDTASVSGNIGTIKVADASAVLLFGPTVVSATQQKSPAGLWTGDTAFRIDGFTLPGLAADKVRLTTRVIESSGQATYALDVSADNLRGNGLAGKAARVDFYAERLDAPALGKLFRLMGQYPDPRQIPGSQLEPVLGRLIANGPEVTLKTLKIPLPDADLEGDAFVSIDPGSGRALSELIRGGRANATFLVPQTMVDHIRRHAAPEIQSGIDVMMGLRLLVADGNRYRIEASYANNLLMINGLPVPIPNF